MPKLTKLSAEEVEALKKKKSGLSDRERIRQQYIDYLKTFNAGDWVVVALEEGERRQTVKNRLKTAANQLGYNLNFIRSRSDLKFEIQKA